MSRARYPALTVLTVVAVLSACSGGGGPKQSAPTTTTTTPAERIASTKVAPLRAFCGHITDLVTATAQVGVVTELSQVRTRLTAAVRLVDQATTAGTPAGSGTFPILLALDNDLHVVDVWVQTEATQDDLDHNRQPPDVQAHFTDLGVRFRALQAWSNPHCKAFGGGDG